MHLMLWLNDVYLGGDIEGDVPLKHPTLHSGFSSLLQWGLKYLPLWTSSPDFTSAMSSISPYTRFGPQFKHARGVDIAMGDIKSISTYPHYWKSFFCLAY